MTNRITPISDRPGKMSPSGHRRATLTLFVPSSTMVTFYDEIVPELHDFITTQAVFFTGTAPLHIPNSHINVSPKGYAESAFTVVNPKCVWYQDATGSGIHSFHYK